MKNEKFIKSVAELENALTYKAKALKEPFFYAGLTKSFETSFEYAWKYLKIEVTSQGLEAFSPREVIKLSGRVGLIGDVEKWLEFLENRNLAVHDYLSITKEKYISVIEEYLKEAKKLTKDK